MNDEVIKVFHVFFTKSAKKYIFLMLDDVLGGFDGLEQHNLIRVPLSLFSDEYKETLYHDMKNTFSHEQYFHHTPVMNFHHNHS